MPVLLVVDRTRLDPRRDKDRGDSVAGAIEREAELAFGRGRIGRRNLSWSHVVVGAARLIPADQQGGVPDVRARCRGGGSVGVEDPFQEGLAEQDRGGWVEPLDVELGSRRTTERRVVVPMTGDAVRLDPREIRQRPGRGILLELAEGHDVRGEAILQPGVVDDALKRARHPVHVDLPGLAVLFESFEDRLCVVLREPLRHRGVHHQA